jgi:quinol monooxygenase YgiN
MKAIIVFKVILISFLLTSQNMPAQTNNMIIRISEIEIDSSYLEEYNSILQLESMASVQKEPGVIAIFPMYQKEDPTQIRILEIYLNKSAYENHIRSPHFQKYKTSTLNMVKSLKLVDMNSLDPETMNEIFRKLND